MLTIINSKLVCILSVALACCSRIDKKQGNGDSLAADTSKQYAVELDYNKYTHDDYIRDILKPYIDSLNHYKQKDKMPSFLYDDDFEHDLKEKHWSLNNFVSVREKIFSYVENTELMDTILTDPFFMKRNKEGDSSYDVLSIAKRRATEIKLN